MADEGNPAILAFIDDRKKTKDQNILFDKVNILGVPVDPWTPYYKTNNFFQRTLSHQLGFDSDKAIFRLLQVDSNGALKTTAAVSQNLYIDVAGAAQIVKGNSLGAIKIDPSGRQFDNFDVFIGESHPSLAILVSSGIDVRAFDKLSLNVATTNNCTVTVQVSDDNLNWYEMKSATDADLSWNCNNEKINFNIPNISSFVRVLVQNTTSTVGTTSAVLNGSA